MGRTIDELIASAQKRFELNDNFVKEVTTLIDLGVVAHTGGNMWIVDGYTVNQYTKTCTCPKNYPHNEKIGKMCPHVFAMTVVRLFEQENPKERIALDDILRKDGIKEIRIEWNYDDNRRTVIGYVDRNGVTRLKSDEKFSTDLQRFSAALRRNDYCLDGLPHKLEGTFEYIYRYPLSKTSGIVLTESIWNLRSVTNAMVEAKVRRDIAQRFEKEFTR